MPGVISDILNAASGIAQRISEAEDSDIIVWNGPIYEEGFGKLVKEAPYAYNNVIFILVTYGGDANVAYRIARLLQESYQRVTVFVPSICASAGTLVTLGAHKLVLSDFAELGPLDVQVYKRDEIGERRSGLLLRSALTSLGQECNQLFGSLLYALKSNTGGLVRFKLASELAQKIVVGVMSPIYEQLNPEALGQDYQDMNIAYEYGIRLSRISSITDKEGVYRLVHKYPSHDFVIDKREASEIFKAIDNPTDDMYDLTDALGQLAFRPNARQVTVRAFREESDNSEERDDDDATNSQGEESFVGDGRSGEAEASVAALRRRYRRAD